jgi:rSAM/selenodomain-associated transferase 1
MTTSPDLLFIVARAPVAGTTKTRLAATIGNERACALYRAFLSDLAHRFTGKGPYDLAWGYCPAGADFRADLTRISGAPISDSVHFVPQHGNTFNERLTNLFRWGFDAGYRRVAIMASDSPHLPESIATDAFANLTHHDVTLGRVTDGGYYLIGLSGFSDLLLNLPMSTSDAGDAVAHRVADLGLRFGEITPSFDIDEERDLDLLYRALAPDGACAPRTWAALTDYWHNPLLPRHSDLMAHASSD